MNKMNTPVENKKNKILLGLICLAVFIALLIAGLWPFKFHPENQVKWLDNTSGISFYGQGAIYSPAPFDFLKYGGPKNGSITIEMSLRPKADCGGGLPRIISFYDDQESEDFFIGQWKSHLILRNVTNTSENHWIERGVNLKDVLDKDILVTITADEKGTTAFIDGKPVNHFPDFSLTDNINRPVSLMIGNSPTGVEYWEGDLYSLALYKKALTPEEVYKSYGDWVQQNFEGISKTEGLTTLYLFNEKGGTLIRDHSGAQRNLLMPATFSTLKKTVLSLPWKDFRWDKSYLKDFFINLTGFIPFGFLFASFVRKATTLSDSRIYIFTIITGCIISLSIEIIQIYLPTRSSSLTDLILNVTGTVLGALLYHRRTLLLPSRNN